MTIKQQLRMLLCEYVIDRNTLEEIAVPKSATEKSMRSIAAEHNLSVSVVSGEVRVADEYYTYAVRNGSVQTIAG